jgi:hypothetical protein
MLRRSPRPLPLPPGPPNMPMMLMDMLAWPPCKKGSVRMQPGFWSKAVLKNLVQTLR